MSRLPWPPNPYDFSAPATDAVFAGREREREIIRGWAAGLSDERTGHLLIHGRRGVGKTSLLGQVRKELEKRGLLHETVTLDEGAVEESELLLAVVLAISRGVVRAGGFGGIDGGYYVGLQQALAGDRMDPDAGPSRVARFVTRARQNPRPARIPESLLLDDLADLMDEARGLGSLGFVVLVDEADRLTAEAAAVQRLRNHLVMPGLISTVLCGTDEVLTALDAAFAPIGRHFQHFELRPLGDMAEVLECVLKPLQNAGLAERVVPGHNFFGELYRLTRGSPYEIARLCHIIYERLKADNPESMHFTLSDEVIEEAAVQLRPAPEDEAALATLRRAEDEVLGSAARYCVDPSLTIHEHALLTMAFEPITPDGQTATQDDVAADWAELERLGLATSNRIFLSPSFGELGRLYLKYRARARDIPVARIEGSYAERMSDRVTDDLAEGAVRHFGDDYQVMFPRNHVPLEGGIHPGTRDFMEAVTSGNLEEIERQSTFITGVPYLLSPKRMPEAVEHGHLLIAVAFEVAEDTFEAVMLITPSGDDWPAKVDQFMTEVPAIFAPMVPYRITLHSARHVELSDDAWRTLWLQRSMLFETVFVVGMWEAGDIRGAVTASRQYVDTHAAFLDTRGNWPDGALRLLNNLGFMELTAGHMVEAERDFVRASVQGGLNPYRPPIERAVLMCNLAAVNAGLGRYPEAIEWCDKAIALNDRESVPDAGWLCVYSPTPDWAHRPTMVVQPSTLDVAVMTKASCLAAIDDPSAAAVADLVTADASHEWACEVLEQIALRLNDEELAAEARSLTELAKQRDDDDADREGDAA